MVVEMTDDDGDSIQGGWQSAQDSPAPSTREHAYPHRLGADSAPILRELLGLSEDDVAGLANDGIIAVG